MAANTTAFKRFAPHPLLNRYIRFFWTLEMPAREASGVEQSFFTEAGMELVFNFGAPFSVSGADGGNGALGDAFLVGAMTRAGKGRTRGDCRLLGVCFRPGGTCAFMGIPAWQLTDRAVTIADVLGKSGRGLFPSLAGEPSVACRLERLNRYFLDCIARKRSKTMDADCRDHAIGLIHRARGTLSVAAMTRRLGVSARHLERVFRDAVGISPKRTCRVVRFTHAIARIDSVACPDWAALAVDCGYYDQAHLIREFRSFTGLSPEGYRRQRPGLETFLSREPLATPASDPAPMP